MYSQMDLSHLEGLFLRLRVGNTEKGHGGTGYHVAYIDGICELIIHHSDLYKFLIHDKAFQCTLKISFPQAYKVKICVEAPSLFYP